MSTRRERKRARLIVSGELPLEVDLPRWERELIIAALARLARPTTQPPKTEQHHATP